MCSRRASAADPPPWERWSDEIVRQVETFWRPGPLRVLEPTRSSRHWSGIVRTRE
jgi:hypothetical protein